MLSKLQKNSDGKDKLENYIEVSLNEIYSSKIKPKKRDWGRVLVTPFVAVLMAYWSYVMSRDGFSGWSVLLGVMALASLSSFVDEFMKSDESDKNSESNESDSDAVKKHKT